jgi:4-hydroxybenzoate polyprenyltransferase
MIFPCVFREDAPMNFVNLFRADFGSDLAVRDVYDFKARLMGYLTLARPLFLVLTPLNAASAAVLSIRGLPTWELCLVGFFTGALAAAGVNIFNKYADRERDRTIWPQRAIPAGRIKAGGALALSMTCYAAALALCWLYFNPTSFYILLAAMALGSLYSSFLRDRVGYLSLPPVEGLIFLCGWACLSPGTVFTTLLPWYLYLLGMVWQSAHILAHYVLNIRYDEEGKADIMTPVFCSKPTAAKAARLTLVFTILLFLMSVLLPLLTSLSWLYVVPVAGYGLFTLYRCRAFFRSSLDNDKVHQAWSALSTFRLIISAAIILSLLVYH